MEGLDNIIAEAESVGTSGRHKDLNNKIIEFGQKTNDEDFWLEKIFSGLAFRNFHDFLKLKNIIADNEKNDLSVIAYYSRNLMEISIWTAYCTKSKNHAHNFYSDLGRDSIDLLKNNLKVGVDEEKTEIIKKNLIERAAKQNVNDIEKRFTRVRDAAKEIGIEELFVCSNKQLSKFSHPTALQIISPRTGKEAQELAKSFYTQACVQFVRSVELLEMRYGIIHDGDVGVNY